MFEREQVPRNKESHNATLSGAGLLFYSECEMVPKNSK